MESSSLNYACRFPQAIDYYCRETREQNWTVRQLERNIKSQSFQRLLSSQSTQTSIINPAPHLEFIKDPYVVKYSVIQESPQLFAAKYQRILPTEAELIAEIEREKRLIEKLS